MLGFMQPTPEQTKAEAPEVEPADDYLEAEPVPDLAFVQLDADEPTEPDQEAPC
jgi:hypothetical protein